MGIGKFLKSLEKKQAEELIPILEGMIEQLKEQINEEQQKSTVPPPDPPDPPKEEDD